MTQKCYDNYQYSSVRTAEEIYNVLQSLDYDRDGHVTNYGALQWSRDDDTYDVAKLGRSRIRVRHEARLEFEYLMSILDPPSAKVFSLKQGLGTTLPWFKNRYVVGIATAPTLKGISLPPEAVALYGLDLHSKHVGAGMTHYYTAMTITLIVKATQAAGFIMQNWRSIEPFELQIKASDSKPPWSGW